jgi:predicted amidophosphoribosyltransferase
MPVCPNCGNQAAENALFCDQCGTKLAAAEAPAPVETAAQTQPGGVPMDILICPACGAENVPGEVFCDACGEPLEAPEPVAAEVAVEPAPAPVTDVEVEPVAEDVTVEMEVVEEAVVEEAVVEAQAEDEGYCPVCGASVHADDTFCGSCGASLGGGVQDVWDEEPEGELTEQPVAEAVVAEEPIVEEVVEEVVLDEEPIVEEVLPEEPVLEPEPVEVVVEEAVVEEVVVEEDVVEEPTQPVCPICGANVLPDQAFCASCGAKLQETEAPAPAEAVSAPTPVVAVPSGPYLAVVASGAHVPLVEQPESLIGRTDDVSGIYPDVDMTPHGGEDGGVSRRHAKLIYEGGNWFIEDLDSTNGTYVNDAEIAPKTRVALSDGDAINFGDVEMTFHLGG